MTWLLLPNQLCVIYARSFRRTILTEAIHSGKISGDPRQFGGKIYSFILAQLSLASQLVSQVIDLLLQILQFSIEGCKLRLQIRRNLLAFICATNDELKVHDSSFDGIAGQGVTAPVTCAQPWAAITNGAAIDKRHFIGQPI